MDRVTILEAAAQIFSQKGFHAASMQDIAEAVSLQKASLYHHISSKQEILLELLDHALDLLIEQLTAVMQKPLSPEAMLREAILSYIQTLTEHRELASVLLLEHRSLEPELKARHILRRDRYEGLWRELIQAGIDQGKFCNGSPEFTARFLLGVMNWTITWYRPDGPLTAQDIAENYTELFLSGILQREGQRT